MSRIKDFMTTSVITVDSGAQLTDAARLMRDNDIGILPVIQGTEVKGVITDRDLVIRGLADGGGQKTVGDILTGDLIYLRPDDDEKQAEKLMSDNDVRRLPVIENGRLAGMVSIGDLAGANDKRAGKVMEQTGPTTS